MFDPLLESDNTETAYVMLCIKVTQAVHNDTNTVFSLAMLNKNSLVQTVSPSLILHI